VTAVRPPLGIFCPHFFDVFEQSVGFFGDFTMFESFSILSMKRQERSESNFHVVKTVVVLE